MNELPIIYVMWDAINDLTTCPICAGLHGHIWQFSHQDEIPTILVHPAFGLVWNLEDGSRAHGHARFNCRCSLKLHLDCSDLIPHTERMITSLSTMIGEIPG